MSDPGFFHPAQHEHARLAVAVPANRVADPAWNAVQTVALLREAAADGARIVVFPELGLSGYTCDDLFHQRALLEACEAALQAVVDATADVGAVAIVGLPLRVDHRLFNCAAVAAGGRLLGVVPKTYLPNYAEFYEARQFNGAATALATDVTLCGESVPFGAGLLFHVPSIADLSFHVEICEDLWVPIPPSSLAALAGATVLVNLSASPITVAKSDHRHALVANQSSRCLAAYLYTAAGKGESTTDLAWDGQAMIYELGELLAESERFCTASHWIAADVDLERLSRERMRQTSFGTSVQQHRDALTGFRTVVCDLPATMPVGDPTLRRPLARYPYVPADPSLRDARCSEVYRIQVQALLQRLSATGIDKLVIGVSGGLDSTHALLVCARAMDLLGQPRGNILAYTMPGFATSRRTLDQAQRLMAAIGCTAREVDIKPSCLQMLADLGHPYAAGERGPGTYDVAFENVQAGERTSHLFRFANQEGGIVVGTGDLSELALGWCTYGVGDHMSHYNVNASVPKTLIQHLVRWVAETGSVAAHAGDVSDTERAGAVADSARAGDTAKGGSALGDVLVAVLATEVSPELVPGGTESNDGDQPDQSTEHQLGPYALHDFFLYHLLRFGTAPSKIAYLAHAAWHDADHGGWPAGVARRAFTIGEIKHHLHTFLVRFFQSQFKRSCVPNAPKVGSGGSLSPRGDWRAPSDARADAWLAEWARIPDR